MEKNVGKKKTKKIIIWCICIFLCLILLTIGIFYAIFFNEANALFSIKKVDDGVYQMTYKNNYYFDDFLQQGAKNDSELINFITKKLLKGLDIGINPPSYACSTFTAKTSGGDALFGRNYDWKDSPIMLVRTKPKNGFESISTVDLSVLGLSLNNLPKSLANKFLCLASPYVPLDGMNSRGVAIAVNMLNGEQTHQDTGKVSITTTTLIRLVLDKAESVEHALELIGQYDLHDSAGARYHFQIADKSGDSAVVEYINNEMNVVRSANKPLYMTNFTISPNSNPDIFGLDRYEILEEQLENKQGVLSESEAMGLLESVKLEWTDQQGAKCGSVWSSVYNLETLTLDMVTYRNYDKVRQYRI